MSVAKPLKDMKYRVVEYQGFYAIQKRYLLFWWKYELTILGKPIQFTGRQTAQNYIDNFT